MAKRIHRKDPIYLTEDEIKALFSVISDPRDRAIFRVAYHHGLRASEVGTLDLADYRPSSGRIYIRRLKGSNAGEFRLPELAEKSLRAWIRERGSAPGPLFPSRERTRITRQRLDQLMKRYCVAAGIDPKKAHMHVLKHSCGTHMLEMGEDIVMVQDHLGHRSIANTMIYAHVSNKARSAADERLREWGKRKIA